MRKISFIVLQAVALSCSVTGCNNATPGADNPASSLNIPGVADEAAFRVMSDDAHLFHCGDRYFQAGAYSIDELKDPTFDTAPRELTQADSLNGVTWYASVSLRAPAVRSYSSSESGDQWGNWVNNSDLLWMNEYMVKNGNLEQAQHSPSQVKPFSCSNIPPG